MTETDIPPLPVMAMSITGLWLFAACLTSLLVPPYRGSVRVVLIGAGVPILGWLTLVGGPGIGATTFTLGVLALLLRPFGRRSVVANSQSGQRI
jgi:hypothetical protein